MANSITEICRFTFKNNDFIALEYEGKLNGIITNKYCTHAGHIMLDGSDSKYWGHYMMTLEEALEDFKERILRKY